MKVVRLEGDPCSGYRVDFGTGWFDISFDFYNIFQEFMDETAETMKKFETKIENQRKELASLLEKNKRLEEENQKLRDINEENFWPNGKAPVVDFPVLEYDSIPSWFDFTFTNFRYDSRRTLNLPGKIAIEGVSDDLEKINTFLEHGCMFSGIFSICRMSDIKDLVDKYNALVVSNRHLELKKASAIDSISVLQTNLKNVRKKVEVAEGEYEKMKEVLKRWHDATGCDNFDQAKKKIEKLRNEASRIPFGCELDNRLLKDKNKDLQKRVNERDEIIDKLTKAIQELKEDKDNRKALLHNTTAVASDVLQGKYFHTTGGYLKHYHYKCFADAVSKLKAAEGTYSVFIHPEHMKALREDIRWNKYYAEDRLIEECSELIQALSKRRRTNSTAVNYIGSHELMELAHVIVSAIVYCKYWNISNELLQKAVQVKYPEPYKD